jgi:nitronate monooxygenase
MLKTPIAEMFGIERPIVQGGLMWIARSELTAAVGNAGGIGFMTALTFDEPEDLRTEIRKCRVITDKPIGVNLTFYPPSVPRTTRLISMSVSKRGLNLSKPPAGIRNHIWNKSSPEGSRWSISLPPSDMPRTFGSNYG